MANFSINSTTRQQLTKILTAIDKRDFASLFTALRGSNEAIRQAFLIWLASNNVKGNVKSRELLATIPDPQNAVRSAAVYLLLKKEE